MLTGIEYLTDNNSLFYTSILEVKDLVKRSIASLPQFFTLQIKRFRYSSNCVNKDNTKVDSNLDNFQFYSNDDEIQLKHIYNKDTFVIHSKSCMTHHYKASVFRGK